MTVANVTLVTTNSVDANSHLKNLYLTDEAAGSGFTKGLKRFEQLFHDARLAHKDQKFITVMITVGQIALGILAYPLLGTLTFIGLAINEIHLLAHNNSYKNWVKLELRDADITSIDPSFLERSSELFLSDKKAQRETLIARQGNEGLAVYCQDLIDLARLQINAWTRSGLFVSQASLQITPPELFSKESAVSCRLSCSNPNPFLENAGKPLAERPTLRINRSPETLCYTPLAGTPTPVQEVGDTSVAGRVYAPCAAPAAKELRTEPTGTLMQVVGETPYVEDQQPKRFVSAAALRRPGDPTEVKSVSFKDPNVLSISISKGVESRAALAAMLSPNGVRLPVGPNADEAPLSCERTPHGSQIPA